MPGGAYQRTVLLIFVAISTVFGFQPVVERTPQKELTTGESILWVDPGDVASLDFKFGVGGRVNQPQPPFQFVNEDLSGTNPKIDVTDVRGRSWNVKWGEEVGPSTFCTRLIWACGYHAVPEYFLAEGRIEGVLGLKRARAWVSKDGSFVNARFQLRSDSPKYLHGQHWTWKKNPFLGTAQIQGLKILILLVSNWDPKTTNLSIFEDYSTGNRRRLYVDEDWGASLGKWGNRFGRSKWDCDGFTRQTSDFVTIREDGSLKWGFGGKKQKDVTSDITVEDVQWLLQYLGRITDDQLRNGMIASGADPENVECFVHALRTRIKQLYRLAS
jgi:hypothetical protein